MSSSSLDILPYLTVGAAACWLLSTAVENYTEDHSFDSELTIPLSEAKYMPPIDKLRAQSVASTRFCNDQREIFYDQSFYSTNQALHGLPDPKTYVPPLIIAPMAATEYWSDPSFVPMGINTQAPIDNMRSGYNVDKPEDIQFPYFNVGPSSVRVPIPSPGSCQPYQPESAIADNPTTERYFDFSSLNNKLMKRKHPQHFDQPQMHAHLEQCPSDESMDFALNTPCTNLPQMREQNEQLFTSLISPGVPVRADVVEPSRSNLGLSAADPIPAYQKDENGTWVITNEPKLGIPKDYEDVPIDAANVYDGRQYGYGASDRTYIDSMVQQPRFDYQDVQAVRRNNFIARSNVDHLPSHAMTQYGYGGGTRRDIDRQYIENTCNQREELMLLAMNKYNQEIGWQRRNFPLGPKQQ